MNDTRTPIEAAPRPTRVWDVPVRVFHWLLVASFAGAWITADSERWRLVHVTLGYTMAALLVFRLVWGLVGTRHARFSDFVRGPAAVGRYLRSLVSGRPEHHAGHNPAGGWAVLALLALTGITTAFGWATYSELGGEWLEEVHEAAAVVMLWMVVVHVVGVLVGSWLHRENLVRSMVSGRKRLPAALSGGDARPWRSVAVALVAGVIGLWTLQWQSAPAPGDRAAQAQVDDHGDDDDDDDEGRDGRRDAHPAR